MTPYKSFFQSNFFKVNNLTAFKEFIKHLHSDNDVDIIIQETTNTVSFCGNCPIPDYYRYNTDGSIEVDKNTSIEEKLQQLIIPGDAVIITEIGCKELRYVQGYSIIITTENIKIINLMNTAIEEAKKMLNNSEWKTVNIPQKDMCHIK